ncbi:MAG: heme-binding domain-containing protein [Gemmatimonadota bacterium]
MKSIGRIAKWAMAVLIVALVAIQLVPVDRTNPALETEVPATAEVRSVLRRACYDCHSNETVWPWYSRIAPVSWLIAHDVHEGRDELNFSTWNRYTTKRQLKKLKESGKEVAEGEMPPWLYLPPHPEARLSTDDRALLRAWSQSVGSQDSNGR